MLTNNLRIFISMTLKIIRMFCNCSNIRDILQLSSTIWTHLSGTEPMLNAETMNSMLYCSIATREPSLSLWLYWPSGSRVRKVAMWHNSSCQPKQMLTMPNSPKILIFLGFMRMSWYTINYNWILLTVLYTLNKNFFSSKIYNVANMFCYYEFLHLYMIRR